MAKVEESKRTSPAWWSRWSLRAYPTTTFAAHVLGYVREVSEEQMSGGRYRRGDMIGQTGLERLLDEHLRGRDGGERIEVDALGRSVQLMQREEPRPGAQVDHHGGPPRPGGGGAGHGRPLGLGGGDGPERWRHPRAVSTPAYGLDTFAGNMDREAWVRLVKDPAHPLLNRALQGQYPPGSVFKMIVTAAGLQEGTLTPMDRMYCNGEYTSGTRTWKDWKPGGHGHVNTRAAMVQSCDIFFYQYGLKVGPEAIARYARAFGLGSVTGVDLGSEKPGLIPFPERRARAGPWHSGDTLNMSIGQGALLVTPLQVARMTAAIANGGVLWKPRLIQRVERPDGKLAYSESSQMNGQVNLSPVVWAFLRQSMSGVVNDASAPGVAARLPGSSIAGKTGTAQTIANSSSAKGQDHAWFASFAPVNDPQVVVVVFVEGGGHGGQVAAPIARQIYQAIFLEKVAMASVGRWCPAAPPRPHEHSYSRTPRHPPHLTPDPPDRPPSPQNVDWPLLAPRSSSLARLTFSLWSPGPPGAIAFRQLVWVGVGCLALLTVVALDYRNLVRVAPGLLRARRGLAGHRLHPGPDRIRRPPLDSPRPLHRAAVRAVQAHLRAHAGLGPHLAVGPAAVARR